jgi:hypothetical protein
MNGPWNEVESPVVVGCPTTSVEALGETTGTGSSPVGATPELGAVVGSNTVVGSTPVGERIVVGSSPVGSTTEVGSSPVGSTTEVGRSPVDTPTDSSEVDTMKGGITPPVGVEFSLVAVGAEGWTTVSGIPPVLPAGGVSVGWFKLVVAEGRMIVLGRPTVLPTSGTPVVGRRVGTTIVSGRPPVLPTEGSCITLVDPTLVEGCTIVSGMPPVLP